MDSDTKEAKFYNQMSYDEEDFASVIQRQRKLPHKENGAASESTQSAKPDNKADNTNSFCPQLLKRYLELGNSSLLSKGKVPLLDVR